MFYIVYFDDNYSDEFDIGGFKVFNFEQYSKWQNCLEKKMFPMEYYFGTNEEVYFKSLEDYRNHLSVVSISKQEYETMLKLFPCLIEGSYGTFCDPIEYGDYENEEDTEKLKDQINDEWGKTC